MLKLTDKPERPLIAASILSADFGQMADECRDVLRHGADLLHVDVMDGHFVPNLTVGVDMVRGLRRHFPDAYLDVHLMVERPDQFVTMFADAGADHFSFHLEVTTAMQPDGLNPQAMIDAIHSAGMDAGMVVNPPSAVEPIEPWLSELELVLVMSVNPGRSGQKFIGDVLPKCAWLRDRLSDKTRLQIDGGINPETAPLAREVGVDVLVSASALFGAADRAGLIADLRGP